MLGGRRPRRGGDARGLARGGTGRRRPRDRRRAGRSCRRADGRARRPDPLRVRARRRARRRRDLGRRPRVAAALVARRLRMGPCDLRRRTLGRVAGMGSRRDVVDRLAPRGRGPSRGGAPCRGRRPARVGRSTPLLARHPNARLRLRRDGLVERARARARRRPRRRRRPSTGGGGARSRRTGVGAGSAVVRVVARVGCDRVVSQRGRLRATGGGRPRRHGHRRRPRVAPRHRLGRAGDRRGPVRRAHAPAGDDRRPRRRAPAAWWHAARPRGSRPMRASPRSSRGARATSPSRACCTDPTATPAARRRCSSISTADPPGRRSCAGTAGSGTSRAGASRCCGPTPAAPPASGARSCRTMRVRGAMPTSPTSPPRSRRWARRGGVIPRASPSPAAAQAG